ncbi:unnamed protein product, partial [Staurois parvus]
MCNVSVSDDIITIPQPALLVPADLCQCWWVSSLCVWAGLPVVTAFYLPPLPGEFQPGICQSVDPSSFTHCNCHPATASHRYSPSVTLILSLILLLAEFYG